MSGGTDIFGWGAAAAVTGGGLWFVIRLMVRFQHDFTDRYASELRQANNDRDRYRRLAGARGNAVLWAVREIQGLRARLNMPAMDESAMLRELELDVMGSDDRPPTKFN